MSANNPAPITPHQLVSLTLQPTAVATTMASGTATALAPMPVLAFSTTLPQNPAPAAADTVTVKRERPAPPPAPPRPPPPRPAPAPPTIAPTKHADGGDIHERFSWARIDSSNIPVIFRPSNVDKKDKIEYVVVKMVELKLLWRYPNNYPDPLQKRPALRSTFMYESEATLINEINETHCSYEYGTYKFVHKDLLVKRKEFEDFYGAVKECFPEITNNQAVKVSEEEIRQMSGGWIQINNTVCPFVKRKESKFVPLSVIQYSANLLRDNYIEGWLPSPKECAYFNDCCTRVGLRFSFGRDCLLVCIDLVRKLCQPQKCDDLPRDRPFEFVKPIPLLCAPIVRGVSTVAIPEQYSEGNKLPARISVALNSEIIDHPNPMFGPGGVPMTGTVPRKMNIPSVGASHLIGSKRSAIAIQAPARAQMPSASLTAAAAKRVTPANRAVNPTPPNINGSRPAHANGAPRVASRKELKHNQYGSCFAVDITGAGHPNSSIKLGVVQPAINCMSSAGVSGYTHAMYVVIEQIKNILFPLWERSEFLEKLKAVANVPLLTAPPQIVQLFFDVFNHKILFNDQCLLLLDKFLDILPYLQIKYSQTLTARHPTQNVNLSNKIGGQPRSMIQGISSVPLTTVNSTGQSATNPVVID